MINDTEIRIRIADGKTFYVLGDDVRSDLLALAKTLQDLPRPTNYNKYDGDALYSMVEWLEEGRDFTEGQWSKFGKMLKKFNLPHTIKALAKELDWEIGAQLSRNEMFEIMQARRDEQTKQDTKDLLKEKFMYTASTVFDDLFQVLDK